MNKIIGVTELQRSFQAVFDEVARRHTPYVLTRGSRPEAALIPYDDYLRFLQLQEAEVLDRFDRLVDRMKAKDEEFSEEEVKADVREASRERRSA